MIEVDTFLMLAQVATFIIATWIVWKMAWKPLVKMMDLRQETIRKNLEQAEQMKISAAKLEEEYNYRLDQVKKSSNDLLNLARLQASKEREEIIRKARVEAQQHVQDGQRRVEAEEKEAMQQIRGEVIALSMAVAEKAIATSHSSSEDESRFTGILASLKLSGDARNA
jgi:F-type H+-transporting ATPase subunit b